LIRADRGKKILGFRNQDRFLPYGLDGTPRGPAGYSRRPAWRVAGV
jgi:hypothetical protein